MNLNQVLFILGVNNEIQSVKKILLSDVNNHFQNIDKKSNQEILF